MKSILTFAGTLLFLSNMRWQPLPTIRSFALGLCLTTGAGCFYGHPVVGILPQEPTGDDSSGLLLAALAGSATLGLTTAVPGTPDPGLSNTAVFIYTGAVANADYRNGQATARLGADLTCQANRPTFSPDNSCSTIHAMISLSGTDEIRDMLTNYGVPTDRPRSGA